MITQPNLDTKKPVGNGVNAPVYENGEANIITTKSADMTNSDSTLNISASEENLSAKYKYPRNSQDEGLTYSDQ